MITFHNVIEFLDALRKRWKTAAIITGAAILAGAAFAFIPKPTYRADVLISPISQDSLRSSIASIAGGLGSVGSLLGLDIGGQNDVEAAVALLSSRSLLGEFIEDNKLLPVLYEDDWDATKNDWKASVKNEPPNIDLAIDYFQKEILDVSRDKITGLVTLSVYWTDRTKAAQWANGLVALADSILRARSRADAESKLRYLKDQLASETTAEVRAALSRAIESQLQARALTEAQQYFAFSIVDAARAPDVKQHVRPKRGLLLGAWLLIGVLVTTLVIYPSTKARGRESS